VTDVDAAPAPRKRRRRWPWVLLVVVVLLALAVVFGGDAIARPLAAQLVSQKIGDALGTDPSKLDVRFSSTPLPIQLLDGRVDSVDISDPGVTLGPLTGDATIHAEGVPLDQSAPTQRLRIRFAIDQQHLDQLATAFGGGTVQSIALKAPDAVATVRANVLGLSLDVAVTLTPAAVDGRLAFTPTGVQFAGQTITIDQLRQNPTLRGAADTLGAQRSVCIADHLPKAVTITSVAVQGGELVATATGDGAVLSQLGTKGTC
jgi:hypothetical protein